MKQRTVIILWIIAIVLGITAYFVKFHSKEEAVSKTQLSPGDKILPNLPIRDLATITIQQGKDTTTLTRGKDNLWTVKERADYPANHELLRNLLGALHAVKITQGYPCKSKHYGRFGLAKSSDKDSDLGLRVTMKDSTGKISAEAFLGKYNGTGKGSAGRFIRVSNDASGIYAVGETFPGVYADAPTWIEKEFLSIRNIKSISVSAPNNADFKSWKLIKEKNTRNAQFKLDGMNENETMELTSTRNLRKLFSYTSFQDVLTAKEAKKTERLDKKLKRQAIIETFEGLTYTITFSPQKEIKETHDPESPLPPVRAAYLFTVNVQANLPTERVKSPDEKAEDSAQKDAEFAANQKQLNKHLTFIQSLENRIYKVGYTTVNPLQKTRSDFVATKKPAAP